MATKTYKDEVLYDVLLARPVKVGRSWINPSSERIQLKGKVVAENLADIIEATEVAS